MQETIPIYVFMDAEIHPEHHALKKKLIFEQRSVAITSGQSDH